MGIQDRHETIGRLVAEVPTRARVFVRLGIDYCCGGKQPIGEACAEHNLDVATTLKLLQTAAQALDSIPTEVNAAAMTLTQLADHIETTHHAWLKTELPRLLEMAERVARKHGPRDPRLREMDATLHKLANEFYEHMKQEETALFPLVRRIEARTAGTAQVKTLALAVKQMEFVQAARCVGAGNGRILYRHVLPNTLAPLIVQVSLALSWSLLTEAGLMQNDEDRKGSRAVLTAAALTYLAAAVTSVLQLLYYITIANRRR